MILRNEYVKRFKCLLAILFTILLLISFFPLNTLATQNSNASTIPEGATQYAYDHYKNIVEVVKAYNDKFNVESYDLNNNTLGIPYVIYDLDNTRQDEIYYYPVLNENNEVVLILSVMGRTDGWSISISEEMAKELNRIDYLSNEFIFYKSEDNIVAENLFEAINISGKKNEKSDEFASIDYKEKREIINNAVDNFVKIDPTDEEDVDINRKDEYTPSFSESSSTSKTLLLYNNKGQGYRR